jgi:hypothetical protein
VAHHQLAFLMLSLRCSSKLLTKLGIDRRPPDPLPSTTALGDWYATILYARAGHYLVLVSERSVLTIVLEARELHSFERRFLRVLAEELSRLGIPEAAIERELMEAGSLAYGAAVNRTTMAYLNWVVRGLKANLPIHPGFTIYDWCRILDERPFGLPGPFPEEVTKGLLVPRSRFSLVQGVSRLTAVRSERWAS